MKPLKLEFQAFGPYKGYEVIDFEKFNRRNPFLICGKTGSGKTMILDAMTYALYGKSQDNKSARTVFSELRCNQSDFGTDTFVRFTFENNGITYMFERVLECKRTNLSQRQNAFIISPDGGREQVFENEKRESDLNDYAVEILGLTCEQFRQIIILPQGKFETFLTADSDSKERILSSIFNTQKWESIADIYYETAKTENDRIKAIPSQINQKVAEFECDSIFDFRAYSQQKADELEKIRKEFEDKKYDEQLEKFKKDREIADKFSKLKGEKSVLCGLKDKVGEIEAKKKVLTLAQKAQKVSTAIDNENFAVREQISREKAYKDIIETQLPQATDNLKIEEEKLTEHQKREKSIEEKKTLIVQYEGKRESYRKFSELERKLKKAKTDLVSEQKRYELQKLSTEKAENMLERLFAEDFALSSEYKEKQRLYLSGICGILARDELKENEKCPVCGSVNHPEKAQVVDGTPTKSELDALDERCQQKHKEWLEADEQYEKAKKLLDDIKEIVNNAEKAVSVCEENLKNTRSNLIDGINSENDLNNAITKLNDEIKDYTDKLDDIKNNIQKRKDKLTALKTKRQSAKEEFDKAVDNAKSASKALEILLNENGFDSKQEAQKAMLSDNEQAELQKTITDYNVRLEQCKNNITALMAELDGKEEIILADVDKKMEELNNAKEEYIIIETTLKNLLLRIEKTKESVEKLQKEYDDNFQRAAEDFEFAKILKGSNDKIGLQTYVLAIMFNKVIAEANEMLKSVHNGRYHLFRTDEKVGGKHARGLNLKVIDSYSPDENGRAVSGLSGGEKFLVSLALAIGMSTVAQKSGIKIEAMFIDEGFGTLDETSIDDALSVLDGVQRSNSLVGIISHVQVLRDNISQKIEVKKSDKGSSIDFCY